MRCIDDYDTGAHTEQNSHAVHTLKHQNVCVNEFRFPFSAGAVSKKVPRIDEEKC